MIQVSSDGPIALAEYQLRLPAYEGPLDVLLRLIERSQLAIEDVSLVAVTHQFLAFVERMTEASPEVIAEFAAVGARLTVLKSRSLLPRPPVPDDEAPQSDLTTQLLEYRRIKHLAEQFRRVHESGTASYAGSIRGAVELPRGARAVKLAHHDAASLMRSVRRRLSVAPRPSTIVRQRPLLSLSELVVRLTDRVDRLSHVGFSTVVRDCRGRTDVATAFLAVLVLVRRQSIVASQGDMFSEIELRRPCGSSPPDPPPGEDDERPFGYGTDHDG